MIELTRKVAIQEALRLCLELVHFSAYLSMSSRERLKISLLNMSGKKNLSLYDLKYHA